MGLPDSSVLLNGTPSLDLTGLEVLVVVQDAAARSPACGDAGVKTQRHDETDDRADENAQQKKF